MSKQLYELMRVKIIEAGRRQDDFVPPSYAYAWASHVFPLLHETSVQHAFANEFEILEREVSLVHSFMADEWTAKRPLTFYQLEDEFGGKDGGYSGARANLGRWKLMRIVRYIALEGRRDRFDDAFWKQLLENGSCPAEALRLDRPFELGDLSIF